MKTSLSKNPDINYLAKVIQIKNIRKHNNADRLQITEVDFNSIITGMDAKVGDIYVYFPVECQINNEYLTYTNSYDKPELNKDGKSKGFFSSKCRVKALTLRSEKSMGYIVPISTIEEFINNKVEYVLNEEFDTIGDIRICRKYIPLCDKIPSDPVIKVVKEKKKLQSRLIDKQFRLHNDTTKLGRNIYKIDPTTYIGVHYKKHGTSFVCGNLLVNKKLNWVERVIKKLGINVVDKEYDFIYSSRKVIKNKYHDQKNFNYYKEDIWKDVMEEIKDRIPKGFTIYGEILGYLKDGKEIQKDYDYGAEKGKHIFYVYRITITNIDGSVIELDDLQIQQFCDKFGLNYSNTFMYYGEAQNLFNIPIDENWRDKFVEKLTETYLEGNCWMCKNKVPAEGIVVRIQNAFYYEAYKLKSFKFLKKETETLDLEIVNIEDDEE